MGNSNSNHHNGQHGHGAPLQWSQSLDGPDNRNRMKKGYFPQRHYMGPAHNGLAPPQKVLPTVNPTEAAMRLKPTSNGAILHKGGTISGRKLQLLNELASNQPIESLDLIDETDSLGHSRGNPQGRRRHYSSSSILMPNDCASLNGELSGGLSTPNLASMDQFPPSNDFSRRSQRSIGGHRIILDNGMGSSRDYGSEPDLTRDLDSAISRERSVSPLPNSFTLISESPAKKQIRTKKKYQAPPPPRPGSSNGYQPGDNGTHELNHFGRNSERSTSIDSDGFGGKKKIQRLFKTKAQTKLSASGSGSPGSKGGDSCSSSERRVLAESMIILTPLKPERPWSNKLLNNNINNNKSSNLLSRSNKEDKRREGEEKPLGSKALDNNNLRNVGKTRDSEVVGNVENPSKSMAHKSSPPPLYPSKEDEKRRMEASDNQRAEGERVEDGRIMRNGGLHGREEVSGRYDSQQQRQHQEHQRQDPETHHNFLKKQQQQRQTSPANRAANTSTSVTSTAINLNQNQSRIATTTTTHTTSSVSSTQINIQPHQQPNPANKGQLNGSDVKDAAPLLLDGKGGKPPGRSYYYYDNRNHDEDSVEANSNKKTFYFGMDSGNASGVKEPAPSAPLSLQEKVTTSSSPSRQLTPDIPSGGNDNGKFGKKTSKSGETNGITKNLVVNIKKYGEGERKEMNHFNHNNNHNLQQGKSVLSKEESLVSSKKTSVTKTTVVTEKLSSHSRQDQFKITQATPLVSPGVNALKKHSLSHQMSDSDSEEFRRVIAENVKANAAAAAAAASGGLPPRGSAHKHGKSKAGAASDPPPHGNYLREDSSSELSSSDIDIPMLVRPTLPQRRLDLPRFSPSAAWRALDSPRASGRSLSSEDGFTYEDRIQRYTRPSAPPRTNTERSGDSGISAGDAASPANAAPDLGERHSSCSQSTNNIMGHKNLNRKTVDSPAKSSADSVLKCWTPEQDLDESSSEFEHDLEIREDELLEIEQQSRRRQRGPPGPVPIGLQTPPKFTTRSQLFAKNSSANSSINGGRGYNQKINNSNGFISDSPSPPFNNPHNNQEDHHQQPHHYLHRQHLYARSSKTGGNSPSKTGEELDSQNDYPNQQPANQPHHHHHHSSIVQISNGENMADTHENNAPRISHTVHPPAASEKPPGYRQHYRPKPKNHKRQQQDHGFVGLDTNWFLSRSEPNSLNTLSDFIGADQQKQSPKLSLAPAPNAGTERLGLLDKIFPAEKPSGRQIRDRNPRKSSRDDFYQGPSQDELLTMGSGENQESRSEIGYGPSSMSFFSSSSTAYNSNNVDNKLGQCTRENFLDEQESGSNSLLQFRRPFSHIMYLPSYDSRRASPYYQNNRRTKSVDHLDSAECKLFKTSDYSSGGIKKERFSRRDYIERALQTHYPGDGAVSSAKPRVIQHKIHLSDDEEDMRRRHRKQEQESADQEEQLQIQLIQEQEKEQHIQNQINKKKKFKFQSTLRVLERKKIEETLAKEAEEKESQRLREIEAMKKVEEEFQRKRAQREKSLEIQLNNEKNTRSVNNVNERESLRNAHGEVRGEWDDLRTEVVRKNYVKDNHNNNNKNHKGKSSASIISSASTEIGSHHIGGKKIVNGGSASGSSNGSTSDKYQAMSQRQEPEGAPSLNSNTDLRKELIHASRKRNAGNGSHHGGSSNGGRASSEATQELSEYRQETRQYCDYRRSPRTNSASPARFIESSNSDIFPLSRKNPVERSKQNRYRSTVHPEIVCDIPVKPLPFMVNFSRLSGSASNLVTEDRPSSGLGYTSGPSSVISDNYRRDWAHHVRGGGGSNHGGGPGRSSSIASLHSAPGYAPDHLRHSATDLTTIQDSKSTKSPLFHKYSSSPPSSPIPPLSSNISEFTDIDKDSSSMITSSNPPSGVFQLQPYKAKGYRPVAFKPPNTNSSRQDFKLASTVVQ